MEKDYLYIWIILAGISLVAVFASMGLSSMLQDKAKDVPLGMVAIVKGSIYGSGETMTVFGACSDTNGRPIAGANAYFSAYYPNGTVWFENNVMASNNNEYIWTGVMATAGGTYLTKLICNSDGRTATTYGEWQNPHWVKQIADNLIAQNQTQALIMDVNGNVLAINDTLVTQTNQIISNQATDTAALTSAILSVNQTVVDEHNITRTYMGNQFNYTNQLIVYATSVANGSVDRNDSLLYRMLYYLLINSGYPVNGTVTWDIFETVPVRPVYNENWLIKVRVFDEYNRTISSPQVSCVLESNLMPSAYMTPVGDHFETNVMISAIVNITISTNCTRVNVI